ncbi:tyrosine-protein phosphatase [Streptomyces sp. Wb2n-11]|uniref:tyrosine-protein phosphatase n=1 Tax=Streptomyces sp. Wb2n-11 TaxID=1030533 RepID=UPI000AA88F77|nr:tyrosine-protein phosphatase [Streptomyces sp. Wb2n-11]
MPQIPATTVANLRDLGGTPLPGGRSVRPGFVLRSGQLDRMDPASDPAVAALPLRTVVDFRSAAERADHPDRVPDGARLIVADVLADRLAAGTARAAPAQLKHILSNPALAEQHLGGGRARKLFADTYRSFVTSGSARAAYRTFLTELGAPDAGPLLFHCTAGKDRTGWAATLVLSLLGADDATIEREYLSVNPAVRQAFAPLVEGFVAAGGDPETALAVIGVVPEYLAAALDEAHARHGSVEKYVREGLGVSEESIARIRERLIAG